MTSRFVRFAPSFGSDNGNGTAGNGEDAANGSSGAADRNESTRSLLMRRASNASAGSLLGFRRASTSSNNSEPPAVPVNTNNVSRRPSLSGFNTAIAANDGPSLAAALAQSIRHHARMIDGEQPVKQQGVEIKAAYDPYQDDDHISLAPGVELNYEKEATPPVQRGSIVGPALRDFVANAGAQESDNDGSGAIDKTVERQQQRLERMHDNTFGSQLRTNISNWFGLDSSEKSDGGNPNDRSRRSVRFAEDDDTAAIAAAIANGEAVPGAATFGTIVGRAPKFIAPPATSFRTATRHPSHLPATEFDNMESRMNAPRRILAARKRHRRNDSFLRLMVAIFCFGLSLTFAIIYGEGKFGLAVTNMAYERKISGRYDLDTNSEDEEIEPKENVFYPDWWEDEKGIPDMQSKNIKFAPTLEYNAADVVTPRAPDRIETPYFWFVPRSGGNAIRTVMAGCLRLAEASEYGADIQAGFLRIEEQEDRRFVNVDMSTSKGLEHAKYLKLASSAVPDVIISADIHGVLNVFNNRNRARIFAIIRHPLERAISKYYADLGSDPEVAGMTLPQYVRSGGRRVENNYLTRYLSGKYGGRLEVKHLNIAREFLRRKFVVGLSSDLPATTNLFSHVFNWNNTAARLGLENVDICYNNIFNALSDRAPPSVEDGSEGWKLLVAQNWFDLKIYEYAEHLFQLQVDQLKLTGSLNAQDAVARKI